jgi:hypothetical protein
MTGKKHNWVATDGKGTAHSFYAKTSYDARHWVINHLNLSLDWTTTEIWSEEARKNCVWVIMYEHNYGKDQWVCDSSETAEAKCLCIAKEYRSEQQIPKVYTDQYCADNWNELTNDAESLYYNDEPVQTKGDLN